MASSVRFVHGRTRRACLNCAAAKAKCISSKTTNSGGANGSICDRCLLLRKTCTLRPENTKRQRKTAQAVLAEKVDEIVALLAVKTAEPANDNTGVGTQHSGDSERAARTAPSAFHGLVLDIDEADELLEHFRQYQACFAPYIEVGPTLTAFQLRDEKPLLFLAVMMAASHHNAQRQEAFAKAAIALLADHVFIQGRKSLSLLQGMLLLLGWFHTQVIASPQITNLLHLCIAMSIDLGLNQPWPPTTEPPTLLDDPRRVIPGRGVEAHGRSLGEHRAHAGCFYLTAAAGMSFTVATGLPWSIQLDEACTVLTSSDIMGDVRLAKLVSLQLMISQIGQMKKDIVSCSHGPVAPLSVYIAPFESRLAQFWNDICEDVCEDVCVKQSYHTARMHLYQLSLFPNPVDSRPCHRHNPLDLASLVISVSETRALCLRAALDSMDVLFSVAACDLYHMPLPFFANAGYALTTLARLYACPAWPPSLPQQQQAQPLRFDLTSVIDRVAKHLDQAGDNFTTERDREATVTCSSNGWQGEHRGSDIRLSRWAAWLRRCNRALGHSDGEDSLDVPEPGAGAGARDYRTPLSGADVGRLMERDGPGLTGLNESEALPMDWSVLLEDIWGFGLSGLPDDSKFQEMMNGGSGRQ